MNSAARKSLVKLLKQGQYRWHTLLPRDAGVFRGRRIGVVISSLSLTTGDEPPVTVQERRLIVEILQHLPKLIEKAENEWSKNVDPDNEDKVFKPRIWINRDDQTSRRRGRWTFIVGVRGSDYATHLEFSRTRFKQCWGGD